MGRNSGGVVNASGGGVKAAKITKMVRESRPIHTIKDRSVVKQIQQGISRFHAVMGVREKSIRVADLPALKMGVTYINFGDGKSSGILLSSSFFDRKKGAIVKDVERQYATGWKNKTKKPVQHTVTHELAHATWNSSMSSTKGLAAGKEIRQLYKKWLKDDKKKGYGKYGRSSVDEFFAEGVTKAIHGNSDKYTRKLKRIVGKYQL